MKIPKELVWLSIVALVVGGAWWFFTYEELSIHVADREGLIRMPASTFALKVHIEKPFQKYLGSGVAGLDFAIKLDDIEVAQGVFDANGDGNVTISREEPKLREPGAHSITAVSWHEDQTELNSNILVFRVASSKTELTWLGPGPLGLSGGTWLVVVLGGGGLLFLLVLLYAWWQSTQKAVLRGYIIGAEQRPQIGPGAQRPQIGNHGNYVDADYEEYGGDV